MDELSVEVAHRAADHAVVVLAGEIDMATAPALRDSLDTLIADGCRWLVLDLSRVAFCDSSGLAVLLVAFRDLHQSGGTMRLAGAPEPLMRLFRLSGVAKVFPLYDSVAEAITSA